MRGATLLIAIVLTGCYGDPERYNRKQAVLLCDLADRCDGWDYGLEQSDNLSCEEEREAQLASCSASCEYDEDAAQLCIRALRRSTRATLFGQDCGLASEDLSVCAEVYHGCDPGDDPQQCDLPDAEDLSCSVGATAPPPIALALLLMVGWTSRRRRDGVPSNRHSRSIRASWLRGTRLESIENVG